MRNDLPVYIGENADAELLSYCRAKGFDKFVLVADQNTYRVYGERVHGALTGQGWDVIPAVVSGQEVIADEHYLVQVLLRADRQDRIYLAVGSGTLTDISRFVS